MSPTGGTAQVWPSSEALLEQLAQRARAAPGGLLLGHSHLYTFHGLHSLPARLWSDLPPEQTAGRPLAELAGPLLVQNLLKELGDREPLFLGLGRGRRFPHRLWRLLVGLKAAGLGPRDLERLDGPGGGRRRSLARLLAAYNQALAQRGLLDEADQLAALEAFLARGGRLPSLEQWQGLVVKRALWLLPGDMRLLRALAGRVPVRVEFALTPPLGAEQAVFRLLEATAQALEADPGQRMEVAWPEPEAAGGPLARLALGLWKPDYAHQASRGEPLTLLRAPGRYAEVEALLGRALELIQAGARPHQIALVFPSLILYGQMAADVAGRLGLPLSFRRPELLASTPLVQALLELLSLPLQGFPRVELARVWDSPYLGPALARRLEVPWPQGAGHLLARAGYVDARETPVRDWLERAAAGRPGQAPALGRLAQACGALTAWLAPLDQPQTLGQYADRVARLLERLDPAPGLVQGLAPGAWPAQVLARDLGSLQGLRRALQGLARAAEQVGEGAALSPGRLLALLRQALEQDELPAAGGARGGIKVLRLEDAHGCAFRHLLMGGLNQAEFPARPSDLHLLGGSERLALGRAAGLPVWRTDEEEYGGQMLRLTWLLAAAQDSVMLACSAADQSGAPSEPSLVFSDLAQAVGRPEVLQAASGAVFGELPPLDRCLEPGALWGGLAQILLRPSLGLEPQAALAQAVLASLAQEPAQARRWQDLAQRARVEEHRLRLEALAEAVRLERAGPFDGRLQSVPARDLLTAVLAAPARRRLSPTSLEAYAACPLSWFLSRLLSLPEPLEPGWDLERSQEGRWVHRALAEFFRPEDFDPAWDAAQQQERLAVCLARARSELGGHALVHGAREEVLRRSLAVVAARELAEMAPLRPMRVEEELGGEDGGLAVALPQGGELLLHGRLDRLDQGLDSLRVVDYKHASRESAIRGPLREEDLGVTAFQVPVYLAAARRFFGRATDNMLARVVPTRRTDIKPAVRDFAADDPFFAGGAKQRERMLAEGRPNLFNGILALWQRLSSGDFVARPSKEACAYCPLSGVCRRRVNSAALGGEA
ncbi:MAG: PD-(D/E)XK nuclease family protein [Desulfarculus sp.]|nr:MAG: PD-(D/E)XK nuclease family protein [Desulfarculus sp.]